MPRAFRRPRTRRSNGAETKNIRWKVEVPGRGSGSPVVWGDRVYLMTAVPVGVGGDAQHSPRTAFDAKTGKPHYQGQRLAGVPNVFASPAGAAGRIYFPGREGTTLVIRNSATFEVLATNVLDDGFDASPALVDKEIYLRGQKFLYCIAGT